MVAQASSSGRRIRQGVELTPPVTDPDGKVLPIPGKRNILITSALPYVNNAPHLGNIIGSTLSADVFARYARTAADAPQVLYICGTDEYGTTTETKALEEKLTPQQLCDKYHLIHKDSYEWFNIGFDYFGRTTTPQQTEICQDIFLGLYKNGHLVEREMEQVYCEKDQRYLADRFVEGTCPKCNATGARGDQCDTCCQTLDAIDLISKVCKLCGSSPTVRTSKHLFIDLPQLQPRISEWYEAAKKGRWWSSNGRAFTEAWLRDGLKERCLTRDLKWGVPVPLSGWEDKVMYVWFDAPIGYPSITANYTPEWRKWWQNPKDVTLYQFMGKDNVPFHTILFPAYLMGSGREWTMLNNISTTEYLQYENAKFSKSNNIGVFGQNARDTGVPSEVWRYFLISSRPETNDSQFTWTDFITKSNAELLNNLGNFVNRVMRFCNARFGGAVPDPSAYPAQGPGEASLSIESPTVPDRDGFDISDATFVDDINGLLKTYVESCESLKLRQALATVMAASARGNQYLQDNRLDNALLAASPRRCAQVILNGLNLVYLLSVLVDPFMPTTTDLIVKQLNAPRRKVPETFGLDLLPGHKIGEANYLFKRIEPDRAAFWRKRYGGGKAAPGSGEGLPHKGRGTKRGGAAKAGADVPAYAGPKTPELLELERKIGEQGGLVREIKAGNVEGKSASDEVGRLLALKKELADMVSALSKVQVTTAPQ